MKFPITRVLLALLVLAVASLACNLPSRAVGDSPTPPPPDPTTAQELEDQLRSTLSNAPLNSDVTVTITEQQLNTLISNRMASEPDSPIQNPHVILKSGEMEIQGTVSQAGISLNSTTIIRPGVNPDGTPRLEVISIQLGAIPAPDSIQQQVNEMVNDAFQDYLTANADRFKVTSISIAEGAMTVIGQRTQP